MGWSKSLEDSDLYEIPQDLDCATGTERLGKLWEEEKLKHKNPNILRSICKAYGRRLLPLSFIASLIDTIVK